MCVRALWQQLLQDDEYELVINGITCRKCVRYLRQNYSNYELIRMACVHGKNFYMNEKEKMTEKGKKRGKKN